MHTTEQTTHDRILADRARYVSAGVSTPKLVVSHADGARVTDVDGRTFIDFAGGIGCQNTGHRFAPVVEAIKAQADEFLHSLRDNVRQYRFKRLQIAVDVGEKGELHRMHNSSYAPCPTPSNQGGKTSKPRLAIEAIRSKTDAFRAGRNVRGLFGKTSSSGG
jgi:hypothetical protein